MTVVNKPECLWRDSDEEPCPMSDRKAEQSFIKMQTTIIVMGIVVHSLVVGWAGRVISNRLDIKPADVLEQVHQIRAEQLAQYEKLMEIIKDLDNETHGMH